MALDQRTVQLVAEIKQCKSVVVGQEQFIAEQKKLMERNRIIYENKEKELMASKKYCAELAKEKANLQVRLDLMSRHIEPKDAAIREKGVELEQMSNELKVEQSLRAQLEVDLANAQAQVKQHQRHAQCEQVKHRDALGVAQRIRARVHQLGGALHQPRRLAQLASELYSDYGRDDSIPSDEHPMEALLELRRQIETLQQLNSSLEKQLKAKDELHRSEKNALKAECISLMKSLTSQASVV